MPVVIAVVAIAVAVALVVTDVLIYRKRRRIVKFSIAVSVHSLFLGEFSLCTSGLHPVLEQFSGCSCSDHFLCQTDSEPTYL